MTREEIQSDKRLSINHELDSLRLFRISRQRLIGVGMAQPRHPSLRTGRADFPHPALQSVVSLRD